MIIQGLASIAEKGCLDRMVERRSESRLPERVQENLISQFVAGSTAGMAGANLVGVSRHAETLYFHELRELIALKLAATEPWLSGEIEVDESYSGGCSKGKRGGGAAAKVPIFGLLRRGGKAQVLIIPNAQQNILISIIRRTIESDSIVYTDGPLSHHALTAFEFRHHRINHSEKLVEARSHINGVPG